MVKYIAFGGYVISPNDGEAHYVNARKLVDLYGVKLSECILVNNFRRLSPYEQKLIPLYPSSSGNYKLKD